MQAGGEIEMHSNSCLMDPLPVEMEDVQIGDWRSRLPSDVCTNRQIFDEIFSLDTWNNVLTSEQQDRLTKLLPKEIASNSETAKSTIQELFNGSLTSFSQNPINTFYEQLEKGQYDPDVVDMKNNIMREWKKESLRQLKCYHARLLEDIVVSRQIHLNRLKSNIVNSNTNSKPPRKSSAKPKKPPVGVLQNASSELNSKSSTSTSKPGQPRGIKQEKKPVQNPPSGVTGTWKKRKIKTESQEEDASVPKPKKPAISKASATGQKSKPKEINQSSVSVTQAQKLDLPAPAPKVTPSKTKALSKVIKTTTTCSQPATFPQTMTTSSMIMDSILSSALTCNKTSSGPMSLSQMLSSTSAAPLSSLPYTSPALTSPILASQLQASPQTQVSVKVEDSLGLFSSPESCSITLNYQSKIEEKSSDDDLETSSDEFEAIQPTIGFGTNVTSSAITGILSHSPSPSKMSSGGGGAVRSTPITFSGNVGTFNKFIQLGTPSSGSGSEGFVAVSGNSTQSNPVYLVSTKNFPGLVNSQQGRIIGIGGQGQMITTTKNPASSEININKQQQPIIKLEKGEMSMSQSQSPLLDQLVQKAIPSTNFPMNAEFLRISNSNVESLQGNAIFAKSATASGLSPGVHCISTSTGKSIILQPIPTNSLTNTKSPLMPNISSNYSNNMQFVTSHSSQSRMAMTMASTSMSDSLALGTLNNLNSGTLLDSDEMNLNLNLRNLGMGMSNSICIGGPMMMDGMTDPLTGDVIDKIDDLSVLDGNPFDSIPNLSDELDGLDLDLVDGLCDFDGLLSDEKKYPSFFSLIRDVLCSTRDHRMNLLCLEKTIRKWTTSPGAALNGWFMRVPDWNCGLVKALNFLAGTYQDVHPEDFVPYIEYKYKTKYYQWIGAGRDGDNNLTPLCTIWMENLEKLPTVKKIDGETEDQEEDDEENEDSELAGEDAKKKNKRPQTPPPPRCVTDWSVRASTEEEKLLFRNQERSRFENPHKAFTYTMHGYESVVGPVKGVYSSQVGLTNKARGHSLLVDDRPPYVTILALVRDAVARLPNGEGTRSEICEMLRDSAFLAPDASSVTLNSVVSGALDRLHYERDPCVRYDSHKKSWIYLHRDRTQEQFERLHHNRSYTKSTKSRNNAARKSRRGSGKGQPTSTSSASSTTGTTSVNTSPVATTPAFSIGSEETGQLTPTSTASTSTSFSSGHESITDTLSQGISSSVLSESITLPTTTNSTSSSDPLANIETEILSQTSTSTTSNATATVGSSSVSGSMSFPTLRLTSISDTVGVDSIPSTHFIATTQETSGSGIGSGSGSQLFVQTATTTTPVSSQNTIQFHPGRPMQVKAIPVNSAGNISVENATGASLVQVQSGQTVTSQQCATTQGQIMFAPSTVLRLASALRLSQLRLPGTGNMSAIGGNVRLPQHRILLTRGTVPGQAQTQGILLGQTSTGQTVILSTTPPGSHPHLSGFQTLQQVSNINAKQLQELSTITSGSDVEGMGMTSTTPTYTLKPISTSSSMASGVISSMSSSPSPSNKATTTITPTINVGSNIFDANSSKVLHLNITGAGTVGGTIPSSIAKSVSLSTSTLNPNSVTMSQSFLSQLQSHEFVTSGSGNSFVGLGTNTNLNLQRQPMGYTIATVRGNTMAIPTRSMTGPATIQLQSLGQPINTINTQSQGQSIVANALQENSLDGNASQNQSPMTSPIIIRSVQGDIMLPGHIALGKGVQGIKLIPLPMGNKTVLAKIIPPTSTASNSNPRMTLSNPTNPTASIQTFSVVKPASPAQNLNPN